MTTTRPQNGRGSLSDTAPDSWIGRQADDVPPGWMDHNIRRLFDQWNAQMIKLEDLRNGSNSAPDAESRAHDARTLAQLQRSLAALIKLETARAALRSTKVVKNDDDTRAAFERRLAKLAAGVGAPDISDEIDE
jgi:hypothetical protein